MKKEDEIVLAGLLHDVGKIVRRAGYSFKKHQEAGADFLLEYNFSKQVIDSAKYHHDNKDLSQNLKVENAEKDSFAYIVYFADNIASGIDRRLIEDGGNNGIYNEKCALKSIYNLLNNNNQIQYCNNVTVDKVSKLNYPTNIESIITTSDYKKLVEELKEFFYNADIENLEVNLVLELFEKIASYVPSCTALNDTNDISLYDHLKLTAGLSLCLYKYLECKGITDYKETIKKHEQKFKNEKVYMLASIDISGIQKFIYSIPSENALKQLRARSIYIDFLLENLCTEIYETLNLNKTILLYGGGGQAYFILPNTEDVKQKFNEVIYNQNQWLIKNFREKLYVNSAYVECSSNDLLNDPSKVKTNIFGELYKTLQNNLDTNKMKRYTYNQVLELNKLHQDKRECIVCGMVNLKDNDRCSLCNSLTNLGNYITSQNKYIFTTKNIVKDNLNIKLFSNIYNNKYLQLADVDDEENIINSDIIDKKKINFFNSEEGCENFQLANYYARENFQLKTFEDFERDSTGINRLAFFRADVDDLGEIFKNGFKRGEDFKYQTLSRFATLSRSLTRFFKMYINELCTNKQFITCKLFNKDDKENRNLTVIYSGGDDISVVGSYDSVIEFAVDFYNSFKTYTNSTIKISCGIGLYKSGYPVSKMAFETGDLLKKSKSEEGKNSITLFEDSGKYTFKWEDFIYNDSKINDETNVLSRLKFIQKYFSIKQNNAIFGKTFIYRVIECLRNGKSGMVKLAYTLARLLDNNVNEMDKKFMNSIYESSKDDKKRKAYITALTLYVYSIREN